MLLRCIHIAAAPYCLRIRSWLRTWCSRARGVALASAVSKDICAAIDAKVRHSGNHLQQRLAQHCNEYQQTTKTTSAFTSPTLRHLCRYKPYTVQLPALDCTLGVRAFVALSLRRAPCHRHRFRHLMSSLRIFFFAPVHRCAAFTHAASEDIYAATHVKLRYVKEGARAHNRRLREMRL